MGYMCHHAIIVTTWNDSLPCVRAYAIEQFGEAAVTPVIQSTVNAYTSFLIGPDGSKEGRD